VQRIQNDKGSSAIVLITALAVIAVIVGVGAYVYSQSNSNSETTNTESAAENQTSTDTTQKPVEAESKSGTFANIDSKTGSGPVTLTKNESDSYVVKLGEDFKVQQGPDLFVSFGNNNEYAEGTAFAELKSLSGTQEYVVPANINVADYSQVVIWCREFNTPFAAATLQ
jgi:hypothetical protein